VIIGRIVCSPAIRLGVGQQKIPEDRGLFTIDRSTLGDGFKGNFMVLGAF